MLGMKVRNISRPTISGAPFAKPTPRVRTGTRRLVPGQAVSDANKSGRRATRVEAGAEPNAEARAGAKARLRHLVSKVNAAALPGPADLAALDAAIAQLCSLNPIPDTATSDAINGRWVLLYTASLSTLRRASEAVATGTGTRRPAGKSDSNSGSSSSTTTTGSWSARGNGQDARGVGADLEAVLSPLQLANDVAYRFFYTYVPVLAGAAVGARGASSAGPIKARGNFQVFDTRAGRVENQARFDVAGRQCCVNVNGTAKLVQGAPAGGPRQRLRAVFTSFDLLVDGQQRLSLPLSLLNPVGYVDTPYLDDELRISIGDKGSVFIATRDKSSDGTE